MAFQSTSCNIVLRETTLTAACWTPNKKWEWSHLDLNTVLGNDNGKFKWEGKRFGLSSKNLVLRGAVLYAELKDVCGKWCSAVIDLNERIANKEGTLSYFDRWRGQYIKFEGNVSHYSNFEPDDVSQETRRKLEIQEENQLSHRRNESERILSQLDLYEYQPLSTRTSIRLLKIESCFDSNDIIKCSLIEVELRDLPKYDALSYTWGNPFPNSNAEELNDHYQSAAYICCNEKRILVKQNLYDALKRLRRTRIIEPRDDLFHKSPLITAAEGGYIRRVQTLLRQGADVATTDRFRRTALHYAAENGHIDVVKALVVAGSSMTKLDSSNRTPLDCARQSRRGFWTEVVSFLEECRLLRVPPGRRSCLRTKVSAQDYVWIDALCINQSDDIEKAIQVALMGDIYQLAQSVIVWLGRERETPQDTVAEDLFEAAWRLEPAFKDDQVRESIIESLLSNSEGHPLDSLPPDLRPAAVDWLRTMDRGPREIWLLWLPFFRRTWFQRAWIIQEVIMATELTVVCGKYVFPWSTFLILSCVVDRCSKALRRGLSPEGQGGQFFSTIVHRSVFLQCRSGISDEVPAITLERKRRAVMKTKRLHYLNALTLSRNFQAMDPRDKVFSVLSFSSSIQQARKIGVDAVRPDYTKPVDDLYLRVGDCLLEILGPSILSLVGCGISSVIKGLPSWVPDLSSPMRYKPLECNVSALTYEIGEQRDYTRYNATGNNFQSQAVQTIHTRCLALRGYRWDKVVDVSLPGLTDIKENVAGLGDFTRLLSKIDGSSGQKLEILWRTIISDEAFGKHPAPNLTTEFVQWLKLISFIETIGCTSHMSRDIISLENASHALKPQRPEGDMLATIEAVQLYFKELSIEFPSKELDEWKNFEFLREQNINWASWYFGFTGRAQKFGDIIHKKDMSRCLFRTERGFLGKGMEEIKQGDLIYIIPGTTVPHVLRQTEDGWHRLVGEAYVHGIMHGEAVENNDVVLDDLYIL